VATKPKDIAAAGPNALAEAVTASAQQIWQAGLGAFAKAQQDGGKMFDMLVRDGAELHQMTQQFSTDKFFGGTGKVGRLAENVSRQASGSWEKLEKLFEDRVARSLRSLGVPSRGEVDELRREIDALKAAMTPPAPAARGAAASKPAAKASKAAIKRAPAKGAAAAPKRPSRPAGMRP
jgi:poly(hydroxyalkanoate) granule-associated protein